MKELREIILNIVHETYESAETRVKDQKISTIYCIY